MRTRFRKFHGAFPAHGRPRRLTICDSGRSFWLLTTVS
jgi:hypothetical protein